MTETDDGTELHAAVLGELVCSSGSLISQTAKRGRARQEKRNETGDPSSQYSEAFQHRLSG
jgi:hypothetical protein